MIKRKNKSQYRLPDELAAQVRRMATSRYCSQNDIVVSLVRAALANETNGKQ